MWRDLYITNNKGRRLFVDSFIAGEAAPSIIYIQTTTCHVKRMRQCYALLANNGYNVFALDPTGIGQSEGSLRDITIQSFLEDIDSLYNYIAANYTGARYIFGNTGTGGALAQYYVSSRGNVDGFAQFGVAKYGDTSPLHYPTPVVRLLYPIICLGALLFPHICFNEPVPEGIEDTCEKEDRFITEIARLYPDFSKIPLTFIRMYAGIYIRHNSALRQPLTCPTLVFKPKFDRCVPSDYYDTYFYSLHCKKKLVEIENTHTCYLFEAKKVCSSVIEWFDSLR